MLAYGESFFSQADSKGSAWSVVGTSSGYFLGYLPKAHLPISSCFREKIKNGRDFGGAKQDRTAGLLYGMQDWSTRPQFHSKREHSNRSSVAVTQS